MEWRERVEGELETADAARARGNEGMARVCARRAAGWAAEAYLQERGQGLSSPSVLEQMRHLVKVGDLQPELMGKVEHLLTPKRKDAEGGDSYFPLDVDLVAEARGLIAALFPEG
ncbi:MAG: hypothetical protein WEC16_01955 [Anaerolineales bacterium]